MITMTATGQAVWDGRAKRLLELALYEDDRDAIPTGCPAHSSATRITG